MCRVSRCIFELLEGGAESVMSDTPTQITGNHIDRLQKRAARHFNISYVILGAICLLFFFAVYLFLFAQEIDRRKGSVGVLQELHVAKDGQKLLLSAAKSELDARKSKAAAGLSTSASDVFTSTVTYMEAQTKLHLIETQEQLMVDTGYVPDVDGPRSREELAVIAMGKKELEEAIKPELDVLRQQFRQGFAGRTDLAGVDRVLKQRSLDRQVSEERAKFARPASEIRDTTTYLDTIELVRTSLIRFGGVAVTFFLISLLIPIYRYNVRLGAFYLARADTLMLARDTKVQNFSELLRLLTPGYAFEKEPTTPTESVVSLLKGAGEIVRKG
jgi:hypothetical protein